MGIFSRSTKYRTTRKRLNRLFDSIEAQQAEGFGNQVGALQSALSAVNQRGEQQLGELGQVYGAQKRDVRERGQQTFARGSQDLSRRGLGNTTITGGLHRGVNEDTSRQLGRLTGQEAGQRASVYGQLGAQEANLYGMLSQIYGQQTGAQTALGLQRQPGATMTQESGLGSALSGALSGFASTGSWQGAVAGGIGGYYS
jgi:hypothetical protein